MKNEHKSQAALSHQVVRELLDYEPLTGMLRWKARNRNWFLNDRVYHQWNARLAGRVAFTSVNSRGYRSSTILGRTYLAHTVIFLWMTGQWPESEVDHINRVRTDNRWINLRKATHTSNARNQSVRIDSKSGHAGVIQKANSLFRASIGVDYRNLHLGCFKTLEAAVAARKSAEQRHGFHENKEQGVVSEK